MPGAFSTVNCPACQAEMLEHLAERAEQICLKILTHGQQQVRLDGVRILSFKWPAPRGYGVRGVLVGVYGIEANPGWIVDDLVSLIDLLQAAESPKCASIEIDLAHASAPER